MKCPYKYKTDCKEIGTLTMTKIQCEDCDWYNNGVRETDSINSYEETLKDIYFNARELIKSFIIWKTN